MDWVKQVSGNRLKVDFFLPIALRVSHNSRVPTEVATPRPINSDINECLMTLHIELVPLISIIAGVLILIKPKLLNYIVAIYLITIGVVQLFNLHI